jgi:RNA polymerase sigma factor (sigma-70 family)
VTWREATDAQLVASMHRDPGALEELYRRHRRRVLDYAARRCSQPADVADVVAATFMAALQSGSAYDPRRGDVVPWLIGIAHNQLGTIVRREQRQRDLEARSASRRVLTDDDIVRVEERIDAARQTESVERALETLSSRQREALLLVGYDGLSSLEAARALRVPPGVMRVRLSRARRAMRHALGPQWRDERASSPIAGEHCDDEPTDVEPTDVDTSKVETTEVEPTEAEL